MQLTPKKVYDYLMEKDKILELQGQIQFYFGDVNIIVKQKDVVGNIIQEWLQGWLIKRGIDYAVSSNTQMPPDFYLTPKDITRNLLEVKAFNHNATPAFDIADFRMYEEEIIEKPYMLNVDYLIFGYDMSSDGIVTVKDLWIKKVWEITRCSEAWPLNLQVKASVVHKIRPGVWYRKPRDFKMFDSLESFISAVEHTVWQNPKTREESGTWKKRFLDSYEKFYGVRLDIPRWDDISDLYKIKKDR